MPTSSDGDCWVSGGVRLLPVIAGPVVDSGADTGRLVLLGLPPSTAWPGRARGRDMTWTPPQTPTFGPDRAVAGSLNAATTGESHVALPLADRLRPFAGHSPQAGTPRLSSQHQRFML
jgi:hypothetical protein